MNLVHRFFLLILTLLLLGISACEISDPPEMPVPQEPEPYNIQRSVGASSNDLLSDTTYSRLTVELQYMPGFQPTSQALDNLEDFLTERLNKPDGIIIEATEIASDGKTNYSVNDIKAIESDNRKEWTDSNRLTAYLLFLDGEYSGNSGNSKVLGIAYYNTSMVIFQKTIEDLTGDFGQPETFKLETTVINHEFGHILGLVNTGSAMQVDHQDEEHGKHCDNTDCLMYWTAETGGFVSNLIGSSPIPTLDANCIADLIGNGGK